MDSQIFTNKVERLNRHVGIIEEELEQMTNQTYDFGLQKENMNVVVKGETMCQQGLVSVLKYFGEVKSQED